MKKPGKDLLAKNFLNKLHAFIKKKGNPNPSPCYTRALCKHKCIISLVMP